MSQAQHASCSIQAQRCVAGALCELPGDRPLRTPMHAWVVTAAR